MATLPTAAATGDSTGTGTGASGTSLPIVYRDATDETTFAEAVWGRVFNARRPAATTTDHGHRRQPWAVARPRTAAEVRDAVALALAENARWCGAAYSPSPAAPAGDDDKKGGGRAGKHLPGAPRHRISVRSGGHSWAAWSVRDEALLLDLADLDLAAAAAVSYDAATEVASCAPATTGQQLNEALAPRGRMFAGGHCPDVGLGGFLLQGGMGWNCKNWGWACESVVGVDVVTADARAIHCSVDENADLFWAARGAGPGFPAIVTRFYLKTRPLLPMHNTVYVYPASEYRRVMSWVVETAPSAPPEVEMVCVSRFSPADPARIELIVGMLSFGFADRAAASAALRPIHDSRPRLPEPSSSAASKPGDDEEGAQGEEKEGGEEVALFCAPTTLAAEYAGQTAANPRGHRYRSDNAYLSDGLSPAGVAAALEPAFTRLPPGTQSTALYFAMNPTSRRRRLGGGGKDGGGGGGGDEAMALSMQSDHYFALYAVWADQADDDRCAAWARGSLAGLDEGTGPGSGSSERVGGESGKVAVGSYLGDADFAVPGRGDEVRFWSLAAGRRLREVRRRWDPRGVVCGFLDAGDASGVAGLANGE